ncbi:MAG: YeeE/YedE family protein [Deltaproteobacteria bacterium]|nr:MAG: YeeE/YedE family protein [Deltaproteobacteria bacterium]
MQTKTNDGWSPYLAGALAGLVAVLSVGFSGKYLGASTSFVTSAGMIEKLVDAERVARMSYFMQEIPHIDWQWMFLVGIFLGAWLSATTSGSFRVQGVPDRWQQRFGPSRIRRALAAFSGGFIAILGARLTGGCPSGHGISGTMQLSVSGLISLVGFFTGGLIMARLVYGSREPR